MTEISDDVRAGVLGAVARGMSFDYAARADGIRVAEAEQIAKDAGWPNATMVYAEYRRLKDIPSAGLPVAGLTGRPSVDTTRASEPDVVRRPRQPVRPRPDLSVARVPAPHSNPYGLSGGPETVSQAEQEYRGEVVQGGPIPEHREPLEDYVARVVAPIEAALTAELQLPPGHRVEFDTTPLLEFDPGKPETYSCAQPGGDCGCTGTGMLSCPGRSTYDPELHGLSDEQYRQVQAQAPPPVAPKPRQLPCEYCGVGVLTSYVEANGGRQRHGHHPDTA